MPQPTGFQPPRIGLRTSTLVTLTAIALLPQLGRAQQTTTDWTFAVSGDSRNCGDFVVPAIAAEGEGGEGRLSTGTWAIFASMSDPTRTCSRCSRRARS